MPIQAPRLLRDALAKMKDVYIKNPQMGDPASVDPRLSEIGQNIEKLQFEAQKFEVSFVCRHQETANHGKNTSSSPGVSPPPRSLTLPSY